jgi:hypothetical protein
MTRDGLLKKALKQERGKWQRRLEQLRSQMAVTELRLEQVNMKKESLWESLSRPMMSFLGSRGLFIFAACFAALLVAISGILFQRLVIHRLPAYHKPHLSFPIRFFEMFYRMLVLFCTVASVFVVFYIARDWMLMSLAILIFIGVLWTMRLAVPKFWKQALLLLNIGSMREGERIMLHGVPWKVKRINVFTEVVNISLGITLKLPIAKLADTVSRPCRDDEPWFPCRKNDWVILSDGTRGEVTSLSHEMVELVQRGGAHKVYQTGDFLALSPLNLSSGFRVKIPFGISYDLQKTVTRHVPDILAAYLKRKMKEAGYGKNLRMLRVDFNAAGASSLDLLVLADFDGEMAPLYNRIQRHIQEWCVDACSENGWEIPFPQLTVHGIHGCAAQVSP